MTRLARALWTVAVGTAEIRSEPLPARGPNEVTVQTLYSAVSRGTESLVLAGRVPESEYRRMRCPHQAGEFPFPVKYGYASVGRVSDGPTSLCGRDVLCLFPHQTEYVVAAAAVVPLPAGLPSERAVLAPNLETALNGVWDAEVRIGDRVSVVGGGVIGCLCAYLCSRIAGTEVELVDVRAGRAEIAATLGADFRTPESASKERDLVLHASGTESGLALALELATTDARIVELSWFGSEQVRLPLGSAFHARRLTLRGSQVGGVSPSARSRFTHQSRLALALALCADSALDALVTSQSSFDALPRALVEVADRERGALCHRVHYDRVE